MERCEPRHTYRPTLNTLFWSKQKFHWSFQFDNFGADPPLNDTLTISAMSQSSTSAPQNITTRNAHSEADAISSSCRQKNRDSQRTTQYVYNISYHDKMKLLNILDEETELRKGLWKDLARQLKIKDDQIEVSWGPGRLEVFGVSHALLPGETGHAPDSGCSEQVNHTGYTWRWWLILNSGICWKASIHEPHGQ